MEMLDFTASEISSVIFFSFIFLARKLKKLIGSMSSSVGGTKN